jgi:hypothetical protein
MGTMLGIIWEVRYAGIIFVDEKKVLSQRVLMTAYALFLAMDNFFR